MSIFSKLFGSRPTKVQFIRTLAKSRIASSSDAVLSGVHPNIVDDVSDTEILGLPDATIVTLVEAFCTFKKAGLSDEQSLEQIEAHRSILAGPVVMPSPLTLSLYIRNRVMMEHCNSAPVSEESREHSIKESLKYFQSR